MSMIKTLLAASVAIMIGSAASAATVLIDFEEANNGDKTYEEGGFVFDPINLNSSQRCAEDGANPKHCFLEVNNGTPTEMYMGTTTDKDETTRSGETYDLLAFYINFQGAGRPDQDNIMELYNEDYPGGGSLFDEIIVGQNYFNDALFDVYLADDIYGGIFTEFNGEIDEQDGYFIVWKTDQDGNPYFNDITSFFWNASDAAQNRVDCVVTRTGNTGTLALSDLQSCAAQPLPPIPLPAAGWLLLGGLGGLAALRRRKA